MAEEPDSRYDQARRSFEQLDAEEQASFLVEATAATLAQGVLQAGEALADGLEDLLRKSRRHSTSRSHGPGAAEPETAQRQAPRSGSKGSDSGT